MHFPTLAVLPAILVGSASSAAYPPVGECTGDCVGNLHDPSVIRRDDGTYFRFTTNDRINIDTAPSIAGPWTHEGAMLGNCSIINITGNCDLWAPDVFNIDGTYYAYYTVSSLGSQDSDIGVATSKSMLPGSWQDHGSIGIPYDAKYNRLDPNLFQHDVDSPFLLSFGSYWDGIFQIEMANPPLTIKNPASPATPTHLVSYNSSSNPTEGSYQFWSNVGGKDYNYLFFSEGAAFSGSDQPLPAGAEYRIYVCRSEMAAGPFADDSGRDCSNGSGGGMLVLKSYDNVYAPGGQGVFYDPGQGGVVMYFHYIDPTVGYEYNEFKFGWNVLDFSGGWPIAV